MKYLTIYRILQCLAVCVILGLMGSHQGLSSRSLASPEGIPNSLAVFFPGSSTFPQTVVSPEIVRVEDPGWQYIRFGTPDGLLCKLSLTEIECDSKYLGYLPNIYLEDHPGTCVKYTIYGSGKFLGWSNPAQDALNTAVQIDCHSDLPHWKEAKTMLLPDRYIRFDKATCVLDDEKDFGCNRIDDYGNNNGFIVKINGHGQFL